MQQTFSLSRAHKYVERLHGEYDNALFQMTELLDPVVVHVQGDEDKALAQAEKLGALGVVAEKIHSAVTSIRLGIAAKNGEIGLHEKLAQRAALKRQIVSLERLLVHGSHTSSSSLDVEQVPAYMARTANQASLPTIRVRVLTEELKAKLDEQIAGLKRQEIRVGDEINELNHNKIVVEVDQEIAEMIGLT